MHFRNTVLSRECPLRLFVRTRPIPSPSAPCSGWTPSTSSETLPFAQEMRKTTGDAPRRPGSACQASGDSLSAPYRVHGQIRAVATPCGMSNAKRCWREPLLFAPKVHFLNTDLEKECPLRLSVRTTPPRPMHWMEPAPAARDPPLLLRRCARHLGTRRGGRAPRPKPLGTPSGRSTAQTHKSRAYM